MFVYIVLHAEIVAYNYVGLITDISTLLIDISEQSFTYMLLHVRMMTNTHVHI